MGKSVSPFPAKILKMATRDLQLYDAQNNIYYNIKLAENDAQRALDGKTILYRYWNQINPITFSNLLE